MNTELRDKLFSMATATLLAGLGCACSGAGPAAVEQAVPAENSDEPAEDKQNKKDDDVIDAEFEVKE